MPGGSVGFLFEFLGIFGLTMVVVKGREEGLTEVEPRLPQSKSFLKVLGIPYWDSKTSLPVTPAQVAEVLSSSPLFEGVTLASMPRIMKASPSSDMSVIWIDI